ncbi:hypothetical protein ACFC6L_27515 [Kitasatospora phosalacinea]|uniref:hypothetical protein n=1 Tax=Kitasatospora phosalacinea TaxID=2065 RepID=UPI0035D65DA2
MTTHRRRRVARFLAGFAVLAVLLYLPGLHAARSGGLVEVERLLDHPLVLLGAAAVLAVGAAVIGSEFRSAASQIGFAALLVGGVALGVPAVLAGLAAGRDDGARHVERQVHPDHPDRALTVTETASSLFSPESDSRVELVTGTGWSARHWDLDTWGSAGTSYRGASWTGPDRITVRSDGGTAVFVLDPATGHPGAPQVTKR